MKRIFLFLVTNIAIMLVLGIIITVFGLGNVLDEQGIGLDLGSLLILSAVVGMTGSFISLAMSKFLAKQSTGAQVIENPRTEVEQWLVGTVKRQAQAAGIGMPEVAIYDSPDMNAFATGMFRDSALVAVSTGLLRSMKREEVEAVLAHEEYLCVLPIPRHRPYRRSRGVQDRTWPWSGLLDHGHHRASGTGHSRQRHRHVVQPSARVPCRRRRCHTGRQGQHDRRTGAPATIGRPAASAGTDGSLRHLRWHGQWHQTPVHEPPAAERAHRGIEEPVSFSGLIESKRHTVMVKPFSKGVEF